MIKTRDIQGVAKTIHLMFVQNTLKTIGSRLQKILIPTDFCISSTIRNVKHTN